MSEDDFTSTTPIPPRIHDADAYALELRRENASLRKRIDEVANLRAEAIADVKLQALVESTEEAAMAAAETRIRDRMIRLDLKQEAIAAGCIDSDDVAAVLSRSLPPEFDKDGNLANGKAIIADIRAKKPYLFKPDTKPALLMSDAEYAQAKRQLDTSTRQQWQEASTRAKYPGLLEGKKAEPLKPIPVNRSLGTIY